MVWNYNRNWKKWLITCITYAHTYNHHTTFAIMVIIITIVAALGNQFLFITSCSILQSHDHGLQTFLWCTVKNTRKLGKLDFLNNQVIQLTTAIKIVVKSGLTYLMTTTTYNINSGLNYSHDLRTICNCNSFPKSTKDNFTRRKNI